MIGVAAAALLAGYLLVFSAVHKGGIFATNPWGSLDVEYGSQAGASSVGVIAQRAGATPPTSSGLDPWRIYKALAPLSPIVIGDQVAEALKRLWPF